MFDTFPTSLKWKQIGSFPHIGVQLPLSALMSKKSCGIGEFFDLIDLIDWCHKLNFDLIQLLPLNDSAEDPSPYNIVSSCALHPIYLSLHKLPFTEECLDPFPQKEFHLILEEKLFFLRNYFYLYEELLMNSEEYLLFCKSNSWLKPYAVFKMLKEKHQSPWDSWPKEEQHLSPDLVDQLFIKNKRTCSFYQVLQYLCFSQLQKIKIYAHEKKILLHGDLPILLSKESADVWLSPNLFNFKLSAGAPPDQYSKEGQNWGFPILNFDELEKQDFLWWKIRIEYASNFYDIYRIDHVVGLFRIWAIPKGKTSKDGFFVPEESKWISIGTKLLTKMAEEFPMLPIAEDLGSVPDFVKTTLANLGICGTKVMRWERNWDTDKSFIDPRNYPKLSMTCVSTHDSTPLSLWWKEEGKEYAKQKGLLYTENLTKLQRAFILQESLFSNSIFRINLLSEYLALIPELTYDNPFKERINIPGEVLPSNWTYRFKESVEDFTKSPFLEQEIRVLFENYLAQRMHFK